MDPSISLSSIPLPIFPSAVQASWNVIAHAQKPDFVFRRNGRVHLNRRGRQFSRLLAAEACASAVVMLDTPCSEVVWRVLTTHFHSPVSPSLPLPCVTVCHHISTGVYKYHVSTAVGIGDHVTNFSSDKQLGLLGIRHSGPYGEDTFIGLLCMASLHGC